MKRSEMISIIRDAFFEKIEGHQEFSFFIGNCAFENILNKMQEAGMLPPQIATDRYWRGQTLVNLTNEWELEYETK